MSFEITVGPPQIVIHGQQAVWITDPDGQVRSGEQKGLIFRDTRLINVWRVYANGQEWRLLNGAAVHHFASQVFLTNPPIATPLGDIPENVFTLSIGRWIDQGIHEDIDVTNFAARPVRFSLELAMRSDFADIFDVRGARIVRRGCITTGWEEPRQLLTTEYINADFRRCVAVEVHSPNRARYGNGRLIFELALQPGETWHCCMLYTLVDQEKRFAAPKACFSHAEQSRPASELAAWRRATTTLYSSNEEFCRLHHQAIDDLVALRSPIECGGEVSTVPVAGLPWYFALFGRDSLIVSLQTGHVTAEVSRAALCALGLLQARARDDFRDADPGKIPHELRCGELAHFKCIPHTPYYGSADATPLYLIVLYSAWLWTGDRALLDRHMAVAERCLDWIDSYGDLDGDGFQEYATRSPKGLSNQGWKDSGDGVLMQDGTPVKPPRALCELQGYVYAAWTGMEAIFRWLGREDRADALRQKARRLYDQFNAAFWDEDAGYFALALNGAKERAMSFASNPGHCLWTGIVRPDRAARVVERLMAPDMFGGWGIRTLSSAHPAFNPHSYHNGSVWPHDNGLISLGMKSYGYSTEAMRVAKAIVDAGTFFALHQLPELYGGSDRDETAFPVQYVGSCVPQAWAAGSMFSLTRAILGLEPDAPNRTLYVDPQLPSWLPDVTLTDLRLGDQVFDIHFRRADDETVFEVRRGNSNAVQSRPKGRMLSP